jgi:ribonuclease-3
MTIKLNYNFKNKILLKTALTHRSFLNESNKRLQSNERLEFLGDAVLELIISLYLFKKYPNFDEGKLTAMRSRLVQTKTLSLAAKRLNIGNKIRLSKGEKESGGAENPSILADTFEAIIGAIYQDSNFEQAYQFVKEKLIYPAEKLLSDELPVDYKSKFQELIQAKGLATPIYKVLHSSGPDHNKIFVTAAYVNKKEYGRAQGRSKQEAEQLAAKIALEREKK